MDLYLDSADLDEIRAARDLGALDGVTTNPSIIAKAGADFHERMAAICELCEGPVSAEVTATEHDAMLEEAEPLLGIGEQIVIKLPCTTDGIRACNSLSGRGVRTNLTLCFQPLQA
ncbi:MAG: transaldolase family protein, partial [Planctomycetota bacterium]